MNINPLKYEPVSYILWEIRDFFEEFKELWKLNYPKEIPIGKSKVNTNKKNR